MSQFQEHNVLNKNIGYIVRGVLIQLALITLNTVQTSALLSVQWFICQWSYTQTAGLWTHYITGKTLTEITIKHKTMIKYKVKSNFIVEAKLSV